MKSIIEKVKEKGFTISELIVSIAVLSFGIILIYGAFYATFTTTYAAGPRFIATYLAQEGQEIVRNLRDNNLINNTTWSTGLLGSPCESGCQADYKILTYGQLTPFNDSVLSLNSDGFYSYEIGGTPTTFKRKITTVPGNNSIMKVNVLITWSYNGQNFSLTSSQYLYDRP